jgi:bifunctional DNA-binding transcriptional regulator/antitoxin component of YhaV-PrlF toxin-antitoxin module
MNATEMGKSGRVVIPKKLRDAYRFVEGARLTFHEEPDGIKIKSDSKPRGLYLKNGILVYDTGPLPPDHVNWVEQNRDSRDEELMGEWPKT